jgi:hypothetical protein
MPVNEQISNRKFGAFASKLANRNECEIGRRVKELHGQAQLHKLHTWAHALYQILVCSKPATRTVAYRRGSSEQRVLDVRRPQERFA